MNVAACGCGYTDLVCVCVSVSMYVMVDGVCVLVSPFV